MSTLAAARPLARRAGPAPLRLALAATSAAAGVALTAHHPLGPAWALAAFAAVALLAWASPFADIGAARPAAAARPGTLDGLDRLRGIPLARWAGGTRRALLVLMAFFAWAAWLFPLAAQRGVLALLNAALLLVSLGLRPAPPGTSAKRPAHEA